MNPLVTRICEATPLNEIVMGQAVNYVVNPFFLMFCNVFLYSLFLGTTFQQQQSLLK